MQDKNEVSSVIRKILSLSGMTHAQLASVIGVNDDRVTSLATGKVKKLHPDEVLALIERMRVKKSFISTGEGEVFEPEQKTPEVSVAFQDTPYPKPETTVFTATDFVTVPRYDVSGSAGHGAVIHSEQIVDHLAFRADWVKNALGVSRDALALISVKGDSMEPTLSNGDLILLDTTHRQVEDNAIYALQHNGTLLVKRIQRKLDGSLVVKSDNDRYESESLDEEAAGRLKVVGRVVWAGRRM